MTSPAPSGEERTAENRQRAERALAWLLHELRDEDVSLIVLGGLVPAVLSAERAGAGVPQHLGTADVDILLITHAPDHGDLAAVERALEQLDFEPVTADGWRWRAEVDGRGVLVEFLCDLPDIQAGLVVHPAGCHRLGAANLRGTRYVALDAEDRELRVRLPGGEPVVVRARFAGLCGYLLSKCVAARTRGVEKDYYDLVYVLMHNSAGGPRGAADMLRSSSLAGALPELRTTLMEVRARFTTAGDIGPRAFAEQALRVDPGENAARLRADAVLAVRDFVAALLT